MTNDKYKKTAITLLGGAVILIAFGAGILVMRPALTPEPSPDVTSTSDASTPVAPSAPPPTSELALAASPAELGQLPTPKLQDPVTWSPMAAGCAIEQIGSKINIAGTNIVAGWGHGNGITYKKVLPEGDFYCYVDFMIPKFSGAGTKLVYLRPHSVDGTGKMFAVRYMPGNPGNYALQGWSAPNSATAGSGTIAGFGDENHVFHRMKIKYDSAASMGYGWIDDQYIGSIRYTLVDSTKFELFANTESAGMEIDLRFDNFFCSSDTSLAPPIPPTPVRPANAFPLGRSTPGARDAATTAPSTAPVDLP
jgi:hypothetical protein